ncbi:hypothetical protein B0H63DRAFT_305656 [Podospora didyma]|uniref:Serum paraoxonase/arylesterase family protein n=1 Tax=Podospora didyma TaxID=330526 RepID=A0AAE0N4M8_9PEZI|nr:hypothetical protein B0H63DRAFT_305656 [Podospora didyma]
MKGNTWLLLFSIACAISAKIYAEFWPGINQTLVVLGFFRKPEDLVNTAGEVVAIPDTRHCEDLHYHASSGLLFTACEDKAETRFGWFPPLANFDNPELALKSRGSIHVINAVTLESQRLEFENFNGPFLTHGIDVIDDIERPGGVYIFAVNHLPNLKSSQSEGSPKAKSQIELFYHVIGSPNIRHVRSILDPLITTPNDIFASSPTSFYVTNDHLYREHGLKRTIEELYERARWSTVINVRLGSLEDSVADATTGVYATVALRGLHNNNGLAHGRSPQEILISSPTSGMLHIGEVPLDAATSGGNITIIESMPFDSVVDNPSYFSDPFTQSSADDHSGFVLAGVTHAKDLAKNVRDPTAKDPVRVFFVKAAPRGADHPWEKHVMFEDDGSRIRSASAAVLVAIDPEAESKGGVSVKGTRKATLFVTGFWSSNVIAVKVDL